MPKAGYGAGEADILVPAAAPIPEKPVGSPF
jgi:hypothetical protein